LYLIKATGNSFGTKVNVLEVRVSV